MPEFTHTHRRILTLLPEGRQNAMTVQDMATELSYLPNHETVPAFREKIRDLIELGVPVGSCNEGYYIITSQNEFDEVAENLWERSRKILRRLRDLKNSWRGDESWRDEIIEDSELDPQHKLFGEHDSSGGRQ